jgi:hypothetical protein
MMNLQEFELLTENEPKNERYRERRQMDHKREKKYRKKKNEGRIKRKADHYRQS